MWKITKDQLKDKFIHITSRDWNDERFEDNRSEFVKIKLYDDDHNLYYIGYTDGIDGDEEEAFAPLDWAAGYAGCTYMKYKDPKTGEWMVL